MPNIKFTLEELQYIFTHELTHYKRGDTWLKNLMVFINALHRFNPLAHLARRDIDRFCELSCDESVAISMNNEERRQYCELILSVSWHVANQNIKLFSAFSDELKHLERRIDIITENKGLKNKKWVRILSVAITLSFALLGTGLAYATTWVDYITNAPSSASGTTSVSGSSTNLENMEVGDIVYIGNIAIQRVADDDEGPSISMTRSTTEGFKVSSFAGNQSLDKTLSLNSTYRYWFIWVDNTSSNKINVTIGNDETTQNNNFHQMPKGKYYIWSTSKWPAKSQTVSFSNGAGMYGSAAARLCTTLAEAEAHNQ